MGEERESRGWGRESRQWEREWERERERGNGSVCNRCREKGMGEKKSGRIRVCVSVKERERE